jgi:hypothetical protein
MFYEPLCEQTKLVNTTILLFLALDVLADHRFVYADGRGIVASCPEVFACEVPLPSHVVAGDMMALFPLM